jgi:ABC-type glycerol-3-phosphate transport system substrate-binding protein
LGLSAPRTIGELTDTLIQFRDKKGAEFPFAAGQIFTGKLYDDNNAISGAFGVSIQGYLVTRSGKAQFSRIMPEYKEYIKLMNRWHNEKLIDDGFMNRTDDEAIELFVNGDSGMIVINNRDINETLSSGKAANPGFDAVAVQAPRLEDPENRLNLSNLSISGKSGDTFQIAAACGEPILAVKLLDALYLPEIIGIMASYKDFQTELDINAQKQIYDSPINLSAWEAWGYKSTADSRMPDAITLTDDEAARVNGVENAIIDYSNDMILKFILNEEDIETGFDTYAAHIESMGISDALDAYQNAYARYTGR